MLDFTKKMAHDSSGLVDLYKNTSSGHFFDADTMRFFKSRVTDNFRRINDKEAVFITTERGPVDGSMRLATVRRAVIVDYVRETGDMVSKVEIDTVGEFNKLSLYMAKKALQAIK